MLPTEPMINKIAPMKNKIAKIMFNLPLPNNNCSSQPIKIKITAISPKQVFKKEEEELGKGKTTVVRFSEFKNKSFLKDIQKFQNIYLSIDLDVFSEKTFDAVAYPQKKGLNLLEVLEFIKTINPKVLDIVEYNPNKDKNKKNLNVIKEIIKCAVSLH